MQGAIVKHLELFRESLSPTLREISVYGLEEVVLDVGD
jgi:hypothetical protein